MTIKSTRSPQSDVFESYHMIVQFLDFSVGINKKMTSACTNTKQWWDFFLASKILTIETEEFEHL